jgi:hypothetical protein
MNHNLRVPLSVFVFTTDGPQRRREAPLLGTNSGRRRPSVRIANFSRELDAVIVIYLTISDSPMAYPFDRCQCWLSHGRGSANA